MARDAFSKQIPSENALTINPSIWLSTPQSNHAFPKITFNYKIFLRVNC